MCGGSPKIPPPPPPPQPAQTPDAGNLNDKAKRNRQDAAMGGGSLLTGPSGLSNVSTGSTTLLGG